jgi:hypothetical protein
MTPVEESLRAMLAVEAARLQEEDLRPATAFPGTPPRRSRRGWTVGAAVTACVAATVGVVLGVHMITAPAVRSPAISRVATGPTGTSLQVTFTSRTTTLADPAATVTGPVPQVRARDPKVAARVTQVLQAHLTDTQTGFRNAISGSRLASASPAARKSSQQITATASSWRQFLTVRFDDTEEGWLSAADGSLQVVRQHAALVFDTTTGARVLPPDLFSDLDRAGAIVRAGLVASYRTHRVTADQLATLSLKPSAAGLTTPLTCYPATAGLQCVVDDGSLTPDYAGPLETTIPWRALATVLQPPLQP